MIRFMKKVPAGTIIIPMLIASLFNTFCPGLFHIGGFTESLLTDKAMDFILAIICFVAGIAIDLKVLKNIIKKQGSLIAIKLGLAIFFSVLYAHFFGEAGVFGISTLAFIIALSGINPAIYLAIEEGMGTKSDIGAFGLVGIFSIPAIPLCIYALLGKGSSISVMPLISTFIPVLLGIIWGNFDKDAPRFFGPVMPAIMPILGFAVGSSLNLFDAVKSGFSGFLLCIIFYICCIPPMVFLEKKLLHENGVCSVALNSISGLAITMPAFIANYIPSVEPYVRSASEQLTFMMVVTSIVTPVIAEFIYKRRK